MDATLIKHLNSIANAAHAQTRYHQAGKKQMAGAYRVPLAQTQDSGLWTISGAMRVPFADTQDSGLWTISGATATMHIRPHINGGQTLMPRGVEFVPLWGGGYTWTSEQIAMFNATRAAFNSRNPNLPDGVYYTTFPTSGGMTALGKQILNPAWLQLTKKHGSYAITAIGIFALLINF